MYIYINRYIRVLAAVKNSTVNMSFSNLANSRTSQFMFPKSSKKRTITKANIKPMQF